MTTATAVTTVPVIEIFGPVIQGEGLLAGVPTHFVRFGGCDYRCSWCDSMYAVEPELVRQHAEKLTDGEVLDRVLGLDGMPRWVTLSGGNPALLRLSPLVRCLHANDFKVCVETQGSRWRDWLDEVDCLTVSPKPPSSGMVTVGHTAETTAFMERAEAAGMISRGALKIVVFDDADYAWAADFFSRWPGWPQFISVGTDPVTRWGAEWTARVSTRQVRDDVGDRYRWLCERVAGDRRLAGVHVLPQLHVLAFGHARGV